MKGNASIFAGFKAAGCALSLQLIAASAIAQQVIEEVIVTAQKRSEALERVPIAITALTADTLSKLELKTSDQLQKFAPNLQWRDAGGVGSNVGIRGVVDVNFTTSQVGSVGIIVDEVALNSPALNTFTLFDLDRIEVLRGPQVTLYGRSTSAGAINFISHRPRVEDGRNGALSVSGGNLDTMDLEGAFGVPLGERTALRVAAATQNRDGIADNQTLGTEDGGRSRYMGRISLATSVGDGFDLFTSAHYGVARDEIVPYKQIGLQDPDNPALPCPRQPGFGSGCSDLSGFVDSPDFDVVSAGLQDQMQDIDVAGGVLNLAWNIGSTRFTSISSYDQVEYKRTEDTDASPNPANEVSIDARTWQASEELRLASADDAAAFRWLIGALYAFERQSNGVTASINTIAGATGAPPVRFAATGFNMDDEVLSGFVQADLRFSPRWSITAGGRYSTETREGVADRLRTAVGDTSRYPPPGTHVDLSLARQIGDPAFTALVPFDKTWDNWGGKIGLNFQQSDTTLFYASAAHGFKGGTFNLTAATMFRPLPLSVPAFQAGVEPEKVLAYEVGAKTRLPGGSMQLNSALFYYDYKDQQVFSFNADGLLVLQNAAAATIKGAEFEMQWLPQERLLIQATLGLLDGQYDEFILDATTGQSVAGNDMVQVPEVNLGGLIRKSWPIAANELALQVNALYISDMFYEPDNSPVTELQANTTVDVRGSLLFGEQRAYEIALFAKNLTDERLCQSAFTLPTGIAQCVINEPRTYGVTFNARFD